MSKAFERVAQFDTSTNMQRVFDVDRFGRGVAPPMAWRPCSTKGSTSVTHLELWENALLVVGDYRADSRVTIGGSIVEFRRYM